MTAGEGVMDSLGAVVPTLEEAVERLRAGGLLAQGGAAVSLLLPQERAMLLHAGTGHCRKVDLSAPEEGVASLHAAAYRLRPDAGAIATLAPRWSMLAAAIGGDMPPVFDEQVRHIGRSWCARSREHLAASLASGGNAGFMEDALMVLGVTVNRMVFNAELFEKCAKAYVLAHSTGARVGRIPWWVRTIAGRRLLADERRAAADHLAGRDTPELKAY